MFLFALTFILFSCNYVDKNKKENSSNDSISRAKYEFEKDSTFKADSIKLIQDSILKAAAEIDRIKDIKSTIRVTSCYLSAPNSASGCDASFYYVNKSSKTIKYVVWEGSFKNAVGDYVTCEVRRDSSYRGKDTGPVKSGRSGGGSWECVIYNWSAKTLVINSIDIDYMDGSSITISGKDLKLIGLKDKQISL